MNIACISYFLPHPENRSGPTALLYSLLKYRPRVGVASIEVDFFTPFDLLSPAIRQEIPDLEATLNIKIRDLSAASNLTKSQPFWPAGARALQNRQLPADLASYAGVWGYPYWTAPLLRHAHPNVVISGMDSATLLYFRRFRQMIRPHDFSQVPRAAAALIGNALFESRYLRGLRVHTVGQTDAQVLRRMGADAHDIPHPLLDYAASDQILNAPRRGPVRVLISKAGDAFYGSHRIMGWIRSLQQIATSSRPIVLTLHQCASKSIEQAQSIASLNPHLTVEVQGWCADYSAFLSGIDIQLFAIDIGAGTKTSVLTALQHGVIAVGTPCALENIVCQNLDRLFLIAPGLNVKTVLNTALRQAALSRQDRHSTLTSDMLKTHHPLDAAPLFWRLFHPVDFLNSP
jgi:hypothetical protein